MSKFRGFLCSLIMLAQAIFWFYWQNKPDFLQKVSERFEQAMRVRFLSVFLKPGPKNRTSTAIRILSERGHWSELSELQCQEPDVALSHSDRNLIRITSEKWKLLTSPVPPKVQLRLKSEELRPLFFLTNSVPFTESGYTFRTHETLKALQETGIEPVAITRYGYPLIVGKFVTSTVQNYEKITYVRQIEIKYPRSYLDRFERSVSLLVAEAKSRNSNILHTTTDYQNGMVVAEAARRLKRPWIYEVRGELENTWISRHPAGLQNEARKSSFYVQSRLAETECMKAANLVVALSEISKSKMIERGIDPEKIFVIPNAIDSRLTERQFNKTELRKELGIADNFTVGTVTSVVGYEGLDILIRSMVLLPGTNLLIVGDGAARSNLEDLVSTLGIEDRVRFVGRQRNCDIWKWYAVLDIFAVPRLDLDVCRNVTPLKPLQAQALGIPIVASDLPALREITGEIAEYVVPGDPKVLAEAIERLRLIISTGDIEAYSNRAIAWAKQHSWEENAQRYRTLYEELR